MTTLAQILTAARAHSGLRVGAAALLIGISRTTLFRYERGRAEPSVHVRRSIFAAYGVPDPAALQSDADSGGAT